MLVNCVHGCWALCTVSVVVSLNHAPIPECWLVPSLSRTVKEVNQASFRLCCDDRCVPQRSLRRMSFT